MRDINMQSTYGNGLNQYPTAPDAATSGVMVVILLVLLVLAVVQLVSLWQIFTKAGRPGWAAILPIYGSVVALRVAGYSGWWTLILLIPYLGAFIISGMLAAGIARTFDRSSLFAVGLFFLPFIFYPMLAFGSSRYIGSHTGYSEPSTQFS